MSFASALNQWWNDWTNKPFFFNSEHLLADIFWTSVDNICKPKKTLSVLQLCNLLSGMHISQEKKLKYVDCLQANLNLQYIISLYSVAECNFKLSLDSDRVFTAV